ncbi:MAG: hypothetical protein HOV80_08640 [Polyangiaceae bacterium]|nr:hypothetical protein [Polyangiaceae bacterium]
MRIAFVGVAALLTLAAACDDGSVGSGGGDTTGPGSGPGTGAGSPTSTNGTASGPTSTTTSGAGGEAPCTGTTLAELTEVSTVTIASAASSAKALYAESPTGAYVAWAAADGVHITTLDSQGAPVGSDIVVAALEPFGLVADGDLFLLASRSPDFMTFFRIDPTGTVEVSVDLVGGGDHMVEGVEWFGEFARTGRLVLMPSGQLAAYFALHRRWPDGIGHQGDTLRLLDADGNPSGGGWGWGCSHSMDQLLGTSGAMLAPICISDCYPQKGVFFNHDQTMLIDDPTANCAGGFTTILGGIAGVADGIWVAFGKQGAGGYDMQLSKLDMGGAVAASVPLGTSSGGARRLAAYDGGLLLGASENGMTTLQRYDLAGTAVGQPETIAASLPSQDMTSLSNGEAAWAWTEGTSLKVAHVQVCAN